MAIGMTYEQYWYDDPLLVRAFYKAHIMKRQMAEYDAWLQGAYMKAAIESSICNAFIKKGTSPNKYPEPPEIKPVDDDDSDKYDEVKREEQEDQEALRAKIYMDQMMRVGANWGKKKQND